MNDNHDIYAWKPVTPEFRRKASIALGMAGSIAGWEASLLLKLRTAVDASNRQRIAAERIFVRLGVRG